MNKSFLKFFKRVSLSLWGTILVAVLLRLWGIDAGLPFVKIHIDENTMVNVALAIPQLKGALWTSGNGFLMPYLLFPLYAGYYILGWMFGVFSSHESFLVSYLSDTGTFILLGRLFNVAVGVATVWLVYRIGRTWFGTSVGLLAAWFLAVSFIHVKESHYVKNDILVGLVVLLLFHLSCLIAQRGRRLHYILGGSLIGLAFGVKIYPILAGVLLLGAHWIRTRGNKRSLLDKNILLTAISLTLTIMIQTAPTFLHPGGIGEFLRIGGIIRDIGFGVTGLLFISYLDHLKEGMGTFMLVLAAVGGLVALKKVKKPSYFLLILFPLFYLTTVQFWGGYNLPRHAIILLPSVALLAALGVNGIIERVKPEWRRTVFVTITGLLLISPLVRSIKMDIYFSGVDTRAQARVWIEENIPSGEKIVIEGTLKPYIPAGAAPLVLSVEALNREIEKSEQLNASTTSLKALKIANAGKISYDILATPRIDRAYDIIKGEETLITDISLYKKKECRIVATMSWAQFEPLNPDFEVDFTTHYQKVTEFVPTINFPASPHDTFIDYEKLDMIPLTGKIVVGPIVGVYEYRD